MTKADGRKLLLFPDALRFPTKHHYCWTAYPLPLC